MFKRIAPILRIFDEDKAKEFYIEYLEFEKLFEHRFQKNAPLYMGIKQGDCEIHLSEHHGDATPISALRIETNNLEQYRDLLKSKNYKYFRPVVENNSWEKCMSIIDPFGNRLIFTTAISRGYT